jgi:hypothetical protein
LFEVTMTKSLQDDQLQDAPLGSEAAETSGDLPQSAPPSAPRAEIHVDDSKAIVCYANFCRVTGTPEELILDFGLNAQPMSAPTDMEIKQRLVLNYFTAKRLLQALAMSIQRHENAFGALETDVSRRVASSTRRSPSAG